MPGTYEGGKQAARQNKANYGEDFYRVIGAIGGRWKGKKGFGVNKQLAIKAGAVGGSVSRREPVPGSKASRDCSYCGVTGHGSYGCEIRRARIEARSVKRAAEAVKREQDDIDRERLSNIAKKWSKR